MGISEKEAAHVAKLAKLKLAAGELAVYRDQLGRILEYVAELGRLETQNVPPTAHVLGLTNVLRKDEPEEFAARKQLREAAPESEGPYFKVPKVIE